MPGTKTRIAALAGLAVVIVMVASAVYNAVMDPTDSGSWGMPSDSSLIASFAEHRAVFVRLADIASAETEFHAPESPLRARWSARPAGLSDERWSEYRQLWRSAHLLDGFAFDGRGVYFVAAAGDGARLRGFAYVHGDVGYTFETLDHSPVPDPHRSVWMRRIEGDWYLWRVWDEP